jgi:hypothetical protein
MEDNLILSELEELLEVSVYSVSIDKVYLCYEKRA